MKVLALCLTGLVFQAAPAKETPSWSAQLGAIRTDLGERTYSTDQLSPLVGIQIGFRFQDQFEAEIRFRAFEIKGPTYPHAFVSLSVGRSF